MPTSLLDSLSTAGFASLFLREPSILISPSLGIGLVADEKRLFLVGNDDLARDASVGLLENSLAAFIFHSTYGLL